MNNDDDHLYEFSSRLSIEKDFLSTEECDKLIELFNDYRIAMDRSKVFRNLGINGEIGLYYSFEISEENYPSLWNDIFKSKIYEGLEPNEVQLNIYLPGNFIPPHIDKGSNLYTISVPLQTNDKNYLVFGNPQAYYDNIPIKESDKRGMTKSFPDVKGSGYVFAGTTPIHWVPKVNTLRYSAVIMYGL
jgi:hypothetical protein